MPMVMRPKHSAVMVRRCRARKLKFSDVRYSSLSDRTAEIGKPTLRAKRRHQYISFRYLVPRQFTLDRAAGAQLRYTDRSDQVG